MAPVKQSCLEKHAADFKFQKHSYGQMGPSGRSSEEKSATNTQGSLSYARSFCCCDGTWSVGPQSFPLEGSHTIFLKYVKRNPVCCLVYHPSLHLEGGLGEGRRSLAAMSPPVPRNRHYSVLTSGFCITAAEQRQEFPTGY